MEETEARLEAGLAALGLRVEDLELIVLTHQHDDHVGLAGELRRRSGAAVAGTAALAACLADVAASMDEDDAYSVALMRRHGVTEKTVATLAGISRAFRQFVADVEVDRILADGDELVAGGRTLARPRAAGPQPDRHGAGRRRAAARRRPPAGEDLLEPDRARRDRRRRPARARVGPGPAPHPASRYLASQAATAADDRGELILPGHGDPFTGAAALVAKRAGMTERRAEKILAALDRPRTAADVGRDLWRHVPVTQAYLVLSEVLGHLDLLEDRGAVAAEERDGVVVYARATGSAGP